MIKGNGVSKNRNFFEVKSKYPSLFERKNYPLSNIFINNLLKNSKNVEGCYSKDQIPLIRNNKSLIFNLENSDQSGSHWVGLSRKNNNISIFDSFGIDDIPNKLYKIYKTYNIITNIYIEFKILIQIYVVCSVFYSVYTKLIQKINSYVF